MTDVEHLLSQARSHHESGQIELAESLYRSVLEINPIQADAYHGLGALLLEKGKADDALRHLKRAVELSPENSSYWEGWALGLLIGHSAEAAREVVEQALLLGFDTDSLKDLNNQILSMLEQGADGLNNDLDSSSAAVFDDSLEKKGGVSRLRMERMKKKNKKRVQKSAKKTITLDRLSYDQIVDVTKSFVQAGEWPTVETLCLELIKRFPDGAFAYRTYGTLLSERHEYQKAIPLLERAIALEIDVVALNNLGFCLQQLNRFSDALSVYEKALRVDPQHPSGHTFNGIALVFQRTRQYEKAIDYYRKAISLKPDLASAYNNLGSLLRDQRKLNESLACYNRCVQIDPGYFSAYGNKGNIYQEFSRIDKALESYEYSLERDEHYSSRSYSNYLFVVNYHPDKTPEEIYLKYQEFERRYRLPRCPDTAFSRNTDPDRILRIGYVSPDFRTHPASRFLEPLLACHDKSNVQVIAYSENFAPDRVTRRYQGYADEWVETRGLTDDEVAERIRADKIDILVDLAGHSANNRLEVFMRKPAPVSLSWWMGFVYTTGLKSIDYFLADDVLVPEGSEHLFAERVWRMDAPSIAFRPAAGMGEVSALPALSRGFITFGVLSRGIRINHHSVRCWSEILNALPDSRLVIDSRTFESSEVRDDLRQRFAEHGIDAGRLEIGFHTPPWDVLRGIDIMLDCFPHNSGTTLFESIYMGVPFVTLAGRPSVGRVGSEILVGLGHPEWIATTQEDYVAIALDLARDPERLARIRARLRDEMEASPLRDEQGFARRMEQVYRSMWHRWCETATSLVASS